MGLDMYINRKVRRYLKDDGTFSNNCEDLKTDELGCSNAVWIESEVAYWRKANAVHKWFVENVQGGVDDCREYDVFLDNLVELRETCVRLLTEMKGKILKVRDKDMEEFRKYHAEGQPAEIAIDPGNIDALDNATSFHKLPDDEVPPEILPPTEGFFFGGTEYDGDYFWNVARTIKMIDRIVEQDDELSKDGSCVSYTYCASW
jgi:hypothetical protein